MEHDPEEHWKRLDSRSRTLYRKGRYAEAVKVAERAPAVAERAFDSDHPHLAAALNNLAVLYHSQGEYEKAELPCKKALAIWERETSTRLTC